MFERRSAFGSLVHTPCGPRKSGMPDSVEIPAPVRATTRAAPSSQDRTSSIASRMTSSGHNQATEAQRRIYVRSVANVLCHRASDPFDLLEMQDVVAGVQPAHPVQAFLASLPVNP